MIITTREPAVSPAATRLAKYRNSLHADIAWILEHSEPGVLIVWATNHFGVWSDVPQFAVSPPTSQIFGKRVTRDGSLLDGPASSRGSPINTTSVGKSAPTLTFDGKLSGGVGRRGLYQRSPRTKVSTGGYVIAGQPNRLGLLFNGPPQYDDGRLDFPVAVSNSRERPDYVDQYRKLQGVTKSIQG